ncbi:MAG: DUF4115 domain-containing protein, partial [Rhizomicrobium sp.]
YRLAVSADSLVNQPVAEVPQQLAPAPAKPAKKLATIAAKPATIPAQTMLPQSAPAGTAAAPAPTTNATSTAPAPANTEVAALPPGQVYGQQNKSARVVLRGREATRILVEGADGRVFINRVLQPGDTYRVPLIEGVTLTAQNGKAVELDLDGQAMGTAGDTGGSVDALPLDPQSVSDHANPPG